MVRRRMQIRTCYLEISPTSQLRNICFFKTDLSMLRISIQRESFLDHVKLMPRGAQNCDKDLARTHATDTHHIFPDNLGTFFC